MNRMRFALDVLGWQIHAAQYSAAVLRTPVALLATHDGKPFQDVSKNSNMAIMFRHVVVPEPHAVHPAAFSRKIARRSVRGERGCQGLVVTDDPTMGAACNRGLCDTTVHALDASVDLLVIAFDHDNKYFGAMHCAPQAARRGARDLQLLERSSARRLQPFRQ
ncbi:glycoside hydrolase family 3 N-terminal domain-containing protein [Variovorax boronicumulans]|uniref:glycoside hydrolase family 3 N-terminal domain-containing protein n=1 Tax=Variovorax boronicumulans TaxID=436515 RepID=UPI0033990E06